MKNNDKLLDKKVNTMQKLVRNEFDTVGEYDMPLLKKQDIDLNNIDLVCFSNIKYNDDKNRNRTVQFFIDDYRFNYLYTQPTLAIKKLKQYYCLLTPDFSLYTDMPLALQIESTFKNRWCGAFWQSLGLKVIPTIEWGDKKSFDFCFDGVEEGCVVAISTYGKRKIEDEFMLGYNEMLKKIKPCGIICYGKPFTQMKGNIKVFNYNHSEWGDLYGSIK